MRKHNNFILVLITSCSEDHNTPVVLHENLAITNISPSTGPKNTYMALTGTGCTNTIANNVVTIIRK